MYAESEGDVSLLWRLFGLSPQLSELSGCLPDAGLKALGWFGGDNLTTLLVSNDCTERSSRYTDKVIELLLSGYPNLLRLRIDENIDYPNLTDASMQSVVSHCIKLESLLINWENITDVGMDALSTLSSLKQLELICGDSVTSAGIRRVIEANRNLESLTIASYGSIDDSLLRCISEQLSGLKELTIDIGEDCEVSGDSMFIAITKNCPQLETMAVINWSFKDDLLLSLSQHCPHLRHLLVGWVESMTTEVALIQLFQACSDLQSLQSLPDTATDASLRAMVAHCANLESIGVEANKHITDAGLCDLFKACHNLTSIHIETCANISDQSVFALAQHCPEVRNLSLVSLHLTETSLLYVAAHLRKLQQLTLRRMSVSDDILSIIARRCKYLEGINISFCTSITAVGILSVINKCRRLKRVFVYECDVYVTPDLQQYTREGGGYDNEREINVNIIS